MENFEHYKSLVTDEEVIAALTRESQAREGTLEKPRIRPNLNFLQRTVSNIVSSNNRVTKKQKEIIIKANENNCDYRRRKTPVRKKLHIEIIREVLSRKIDFVKSSDQEQEHKSISPQPRNMLGTLTKTRIKRKSQQKTQLEMIREILIGRIDSLKAQKDACSSSDSCQKKPESIEKKVCPRIINLDDSDSTSSGSESTNSKPSRREKRKKCVSAPTVPGLDEFSRRKSTESDDSDSSLSVISEEEDSGKRKNEIIDVIHISDSESGDED